LINTQHKLLSYLDDEISDALSYRLREQGVLIRHNEQIDHLETHDDHVVLHLQSGKKIKAMRFCGVTAVLVIQMV
jgi:Pyruvate/2-oxoglutarate dehydrogenase complex, dihydrolipoamide dehydrogenase (E3) component, and related enzymes